MQEVKVGDRLTFKPVEKDRNSKSITRIVRGFSPLGQPMVRYRKWLDFIVYWSEIELVNGE